MNFTQLILRKLPAGRSNLLSSNTVSKAIICEKSTKQKSYTSSSSSSSDSDNDEVIKKKKSNKETLNRLNDLLKQMTSDDALKGAKALNLAKPSNQRAKGKEEKESVESEAVEKQVVNAVKNVAESLGGDTRQTESELLMKLLSPNESSQATTSSLSDIIKGMKIERDVKPPQSKADQVRRILQQVDTKRQLLEKSGAPRRPRRPVLPPRSDMKPQRVDLFGGEPLGIFTDKSKLKESPTLQTWQKLHEKELKLAVTHPPANYFQEMILWTEQGKFWQFPINNEIGLDEEAKVYFADHVFLEQHLEPWCPPRGPIRHFMELVCVGLSKNAYLTVQAKKEHIEWYRNYFEEKRKLLQDVGAIEAGDAKPKRIDKE